MYANFWINTLIKTVCFWVIAYGTGNLVFYKNVKVNYTRKINHFALFFIPMYLDTIFPYKESYSFTGQKDTDNWLILI